MPTILAALEIGITVTATPGIIDEFHRIDDVGWYKSATFLCAGSSASSRASYKFLTANQIFLASMAFHLHGSTVTTLALNSTAVIFDKRPKGREALGLSSGLILIIHYVAQPRIVRYRLVVGWGLYHNDKFGAAGRRSRH